MTFRKRGLVFAMESDEPIVPAEPVEQPIIPAEVEQEVAASNEEGAEVEGLNTAIEEAVEDAETLGDIQDVLQESAEKGEGVDPATAEVTEIAVEAICARLGIETSGNSLPALESFGSTNSKLTATRIAVEGIGDMLKRAWEAIKKAFTDLWVKIKAFLKRIFDTNTKVGAAAAALKKSISKDLAGMKPSKPAFENSGLASAFSIDGAAVDGKAAETILGNHLASTAGYAAVASETEASVKKLESFIDKVTNDPGKNGAWGQDLTDTMKEIGAKANKTFSETGTENAQGFRTMTTKQFVGGKIFVLTIKESAEASGAYINMAEHDAYERKATTPTEVSTLSVAEMEAIAGKVEELTKSNDDLRSKQDYVTKFEKVISAVIDKAIKKIGSLEGNDKIGEELKKPLSEMRLAVSNVGNTFGTLTSKLPQLNTAAAVKAMNYVSDSKKLYKKEEAAA